MAGNDTTLSEQVTEYLRAEQGRESPDKLEQFKAFLDTHPKAVTERVSGAFAASDSTLLLEVMHSRNENLAPMVLSRMKEKIPQPQLKEMLQRQDANGQDAAMLVFRTGNVTLFKALMKEMPGKKEELFERYASLFDRVIMDSTRFAALKEVFGEEVIMPAVATHLLQRSYEFSTPGNASQSPYLQEANNKLLKQLLKKYPNDPQRAGQEAEAEFKYQLCFEREKLATLLSVVEKHGDGAFAQPDMQLDIAKHYIGGTLQKHAFDLIEQMERGGIEGGILERFAEVDKLHRELIKKERISPEYGNYLSNKKNPITSRDHLLSALAPYADDERVAKLLKSYIEVQLQSPHADKMEMMRASWKSPQMIAFMEGKDPKLLPAFLDHAMSKDFFHKVYRSGDGFINSFNISPQHRHLYIGMLKHFSDERKVEILKEMLLSRLHQDSPNAQATVEQSLAHYKLDAAQYPAKNTVLGQLMVGVGQEGLTQTHLDHLQKTYHLALKHHLYGADELHDHFVTYHKGVWKPLQRTDSFEGLYRYEEMQLQKRLAELSDQQAAFARQNNKEAVEAIQERVTLTHNARMVLEEMRAAYQTPERQQKRADMLRNLEEREAKEKQPKEAPRGVGMLDALPQVARMLAESGVSHAQTEASLNIPKLPASLRARVG